MGHSGDGRKRALYRIKHILRACGPREAVFELLPALRASSSQNTKGRDFVEPTASHLTACLMVEMSNSTGKVENEGGQNVLLNAARGHADCFELKAIERQTPECLQALVLSA